MKALRLEDWTDGRTTARVDPDSDTLIVEAVRAEIAGLPTYGYRQAGALVKRTRSMICVPTVSHKRYYRALKQHSQLLQKAPWRRASSRAPHGIMAVTVSDRRCCSNGFEIAWDTGQVVTGAFTKDCGDREIIAWRGWSGRGLLGEPVLEILIEAAEKRFSDADNGPAYLDFLSDNGSAYRAHVMHVIARQLGRTAIHTPVRNPQSNGMAESFVKTMECDYIVFMPKPDAVTVVRNLAIALEHYNERHPNSALNYRLPREFRLNTPSSTIV